MCSVYYTILLCFQNFALADSLATLALFLPFLFLPDLAKSSGIEAEKVECFHINCHQNKLRLSSTMPILQAAWLVAAAGLSSSLGR